MGRVNELRTDHEKSIGKIKVLSSSGPYVIAEIGANHNGDMSLAKKHYRSKGGWCDCVKFQSWTKNSVFQKRSTSKIDLLRMITGIEKITSWYLKNTRFLNKSYWI